MIFRNFYSGRSITFLIDNAVYEDLFVFRNKNWIIRLSVNKKDIDGSTTVVEMANVKTTLTNVRQQSAKPRSPTRGSVSAMRSRR